MGSSLHVYRRIDIRTTYESLSGTIWDTRSTDTTKLSIRYMTLKRTKELIVLRRSTASAIVLLQ